MFSQLSIQVVSCCDEEKTKFGVVLGYGNIISTKLGGHREWRTRLMSGSTSALPPKLFLNPSPSIRRTILQPAVSTIFEEGSIQFISTSSKYLKPNTNMSYKSFTDATPIEGDGIGGIESLLKSISLFSEKPWVRTDLRDDGPPY